MGRASPPRSSPRAPRSCWRPSTRSSTSIHDRGGIRAMRWIVGRSLRYRWLAVFGAAVLLVFGFLQTRDADTDVFPEFAPPIIEVQTLATGNSSTEVEELITIPIEDALSGIEGVDEMRSYSVEQVSSFKMPALSWTSRILKIGLTSDTVSPLDMSAIAYWKIRQRLTRVPGVAQVLIYGERLKQRHVQIDPRKLAENGVTLNQVMQTTANSVDAGVLAFEEAFTVGTGGVFESHRPRRKARNLQPIVDEQDLAKVPLERVNGRPMRLGDIAHVVEDTMPLWGDAGIGGRDGLMLIVQKVPGANTLEVTKGVEAAMDEMKPGLPGIEVHGGLFRPATFIDMALDNLLRAMLLGILLVVLILAAFLFEWRTAFISLLAIPLSLMSALVVLELTGTVLNVMILAGLVVAIGVVVDDAIIDVENIVRRLRQARAAGSTTSTFRIVLDASIEVRTAITYATIINVVAIVPVLFLTGLSGSFFQPLVLSYGLAVMISMLVAL